jgi:iron-sulfur cluster assembly accessory protein
MSITITINAWKRLQYISNNTLSKTNIYYNKYLLLAKSGGCNGFLYNFSQIDNDLFATFTNKKQTSVIKNYDISVIVDPKSEFALLGTHIDFTKGEYEEKFVFTKNSNIKSSTCGCGKSFSI